MKNERRIPIIGRHPAMTVGLLQRMAARQAAAVIPKWIATINRILATL